MPHVVTRSCCADASCVVACPVSCLHPAPGEPGFATAEMVYVDPDTCVDCGACVTACPVGAIKPHTALAASETPFLALNADYYDAFPHADRAVLAPVARQAPLRDPGPRRVAVVGAGPAGLYAADELLRYPGVAVDVLDRLPTPYGLVRGGVAPDHADTRQVTRLFEAIEGQPGFSYLLGVAVGDRAEGADVTHAELRERYDAVVYAVGAASDRRLGVPGEDLPGSVSATALVGWYNAHPDHAGLQVPLAHERAVVVGNGNVALDVARVLTSDPEALARTDVSDDALAVLRARGLREVVVLGRRGPVQAAFTVPELVALAALPDRPGDQAVDVLVDLGGACTVAELATQGVAGGILADLAGRGATPGRRRIVLRFCAAPVRVLGAEAVTGVEVVRTRLVPTADGVRAEPTGETETIDCGLVVRSVGYRGDPVPSLPYEEQTGTVPHEAGRVDPGTYVVGWVKRGPTGFIGTNKACAQETVASLVADLDAGLPAPGRPGGVADLLRERGTEPVDLVGWRGIDAAERAAGAATGRPRVRLVGTGTMREAARRVASSCATDGPARRFPWRRRSPSTAVAVGGTSTTRSGDS